MSPSEVSEFNIEVPTWRVYPRVHYFSRRYNDLLQRFKRLVGAFPKSFQDNGLMSQINEIRDEFIKSLKVTVIGRQTLDISNVVVSEEKSWEQEAIYYVQGPPKKTVYICYACIENLDQPGLEEITEVVDYFYNNFEHKETEPFSSLFIVIDTKSEQSEKDQNSFRGKVFEHICRKLPGNEWKHSDRIIFGSQGSVLGSRISEHFESQLIGGFHKLLAYLERFDRKSKQYETDSIDILHTDIVVRAIEGFLRDDIGLADMRKIAESDKSEETEGMSSDDKFMYQLLKKLARLIKCVIVEPLAAKYNVPPWVCNLFLEQIGFEAKVMKSVSHNTKHHLRKLNEVSKDYDSIVKVHKRKANLGRGKDVASQHEYFIRFVSYKLNFIVYPLQNDMSKVISGAEKTIASAGPIITVMIKMVLEIEAYLEQTITEMFKSKTKTPEIPDSLRSEILKLPEVSAIGTVYDVFEVHVQKETNTLKGDLSSRMAKYGFNLPYKVKVIKQATAMMADIQHENGNLIKSPAKYMEGTLGAFTPLNGENKLYGLTAAYVVCISNKEEHDVDRGLRLKNFAKCYRTLTLTTGNGPLPLIDIAAVKDNDEFVRHCIMKDDRGITFQCNLVRVSLPGDESGCFAKTCDGGAVTCTSAVDGDSIKFEFMVYPLQNDMSKVTSDAEKTFASAGHMAVVMGMMMYAMEEYLGQTITEALKSQTKMPEIPDSLSSEILKNSLHRPILITNKGAHAYNGNGLTDRNGQTSASTCHQTAETNQSVSTNEELRMYVKNRLRNKCELAPKNTERNNDKSGINKRKKDDSTEISHCQEVKRSKGCEEQTSTQSTDTLNNNTVKANESPNPFLESNKTPTEKQCNTIARHMSDAFSVGLQLGFKLVELEQLDVDFSTSIVKKITVMLIKWTQKYGDRATFKELAKAMKSAGINPTFAFSKLER